jgi:putative ABC transport system substrate-binding protein
MTKKIMLFALCSLLLAPCVSVQAQQPKKVHRLAYLSAASPSSTGHLVKAFREGLRELGYIEGREITIDYRYAEGKGAERLPSAAAELVSLRVDVIVTGGSTATGAAKKATVTIPIVMAQDSDPVAAGFVASLARPGGHITGLTNIAPELAGKRLELLKESIPQISRVAVFGTSTNPGVGQALREMERAAGTLGVQLKYLDVRSPRDIEPAFQGARRGRADAVLIVSSPVLFSQRAHVAELAVKSRLPTIYIRAEFVEDGGLMSYATSITDLYRRAATYVDKILKGAKPGDLPVEQPTKFEFVINLKTAKQIGLTIPPQVLARADRVIR